MTGTAKDSAPILIANTIIDGPRARFVSGFCLPSPQVAKFTALQTCLGGHYCIARPDQNPP